ncbi:MAG: hypothetical protein HND53_02045 [Proteobacteria bacterium]|nr:hypothetical protein [Pseudomonadota bacterium]NOG59252.1 hypothetical protein [Pseudomonadota bacterium]
MVRKIIALDKAFLVEWTPNEVCDLLRSKSITADNLVQSNKLTTNKLIRDFFLLACRASLSSSQNDHKKADILSNYAKAIKQISNDYENLFGSIKMTEVVTESETKNEVMEDSVINNIDRMQARLFYLTTQFSVHPCTHLAGHIVELLTSLCKHPHIELLPAQRYIYSQSLNYWRSRLINSPKQENRQILH